MEMFRGFFSAKSTPVKPKPDDDPAPAIKADTAARLSEHVYGRESAGNEAIDGFRPLSDEQLKAKGIDPSLLHTGSGMHAQVYADDHGRSVLAFRGTVNPSIEIVERPYDGPMGVDLESDLLAARRGKEYGLQIKDLEQSRQDWYANFMQGLGRHSAQHNDAVVAAKSVNTAFGADNVVITGHSKGGGQALLAGALLGNQTVTFNAAAPHDDTIRRHGGDPERVREDASKHLTNIVTRGEALDRVQGREFSLSSVIKASMLASRLDEYGDNSDLYADIDPEKAKVKVPSLMGRRVDVEPEASLGTVARHSMAQGVLPYASQFGDIVVMPSAPAAREETQPIALPFARTHFGLIDPTSAHPLYGRFQSLSLQSEVLLSDPRHHAHGLYEQALGQVEPVEVDPRAASRLAGALVVEAQRNDLSAIDEVLYSRDNSRVFAIQGDAESPDAKRAGVVYATAVETDLAVSSRLSARLPVPQPEAPSRDDQTLCRLM